MVTGGDWARADEVAVMVSAIGEDQVRASGTSVPNEGGDMGAQFRNPSILK